MTLGRDREALSDFEQGIRLRAAFLPNLAYAVWACVSLGEIENARRYGNAIIALTGTSRMPLRIIWIGENDHRSLEDALLKVGFTPDSW